MPKSPITYRECFYSQIRGQAEGTLRRVEWNAVQTELGVMVESVSPTWNASESAMANIDVTDVAFNKISIVDADQFYRSYNTGGSQISDTNA